MASDYTSHYNLDKYVATDKPNLRDQYNAAMDKIDTQLYTARTDATDAKATANAASQAVSDKASQADLNALGQIVLSKASQSDLNALASLLPNTEFTSTNTVKEALQNESTARANADTAMGNRITALETKPIMVVIGDSWSNPDSTVKWCAHVARSLGLTLRNFARGGVGYARDRSNCFYDQVIEAANEVDSSNVAKVYIFGGLNDVYRSDVLYSSFNSYVSATLGKARELFPNSEIIVAGVQRYQNGNIAYNTTPLNFFKIELFTTILGDTCANTGCTFISLQNFGLTGNNIYNTDGHPNEKGYKSIASKMLGGNYQNNENCNLSSIGLPHLIYSDASEATPWSTKVVCKGDGLFTFSCGFDIDGTKVDNSMYIDFKGAPHPGMWPVLLGAQTGTMLNLDPANYYNLDVSQYGNTPYLSTYRMYGNRASFNQNTQVALAYDFKM